MTRKPATLIKFDLNEGDLVKKGQPLCIVHDPEEEKPYIVHQAPFDSIIWRKNFVDGDKITDGEHIFVLRGVEDILKKYKGKALKTKKRVLFQKLKTLQK